MQAMTTALAATVGTGNIVGVATAIASGGPGALFWMWISALLGMATKYAEVVLAVRYRQKNASGDFVGGAMYYITGGMGKKWRFMAVLFSLFGALAALGIGNIAQINSIAGSVEKRSRHLWAYKRIGGGRVHVAQVWNGSYHGRARWRCHARRAQAHRAL